MILTDDECRKVYNDAMTLPVRNAVAVMRHIESALLDKLLKGVEVPEADVRIYRGFATHSTKQLLAYGAAQRLAAREQQWLPIESAPQGTMILCANMKAREAKGWCFVAWVVDGKVCGHRMDMPTHWQPLPPPPASPQEQT